MTPDFNRMVQLAMTRLAIDVPTATEVCNRNVTSCSILVNDARLAWEDHVEAGGCDVCTTTESTSMACDTLKRLWAARSYLELARARAPKLGAHPCECNGTGVFYGHGVFENGVFKGHIGTCFRCGGKGWQSDKDRWRNRYYDTHVRRVHA